MSALFSLKDEQPIAVEVIVPIPFRALFEPM